VAGLLAGAAASVVAVMFLDQTPGAVRAGTAVRTAIGPNQPWQEEWRRYQTLLLTPDVEGSMGRRIAVLLMLVATAVVAAFILRGRRVGGVRSSALVQLFGATVGALVVLVVVPTKWTHHFGAFAVHLALLVPVLAWVGRKAVLSAANRALLLTTIGIATSLSLSGAVTWWLASSERVPWWNIPPQLAGLPLWKPVLLLALLAAMLAVVLRYRVRSRLRRLVPTVSAVLALVLSGTLLVQTGGLARAAMTTAVFTPGHAVAASAVGGRCGLAPSLRLETDPAAGILAPVVGTDGQAITTGAIGLGAPDGSGGGVGLRPDQQWSSRSGEAGEVVSGWYALPDEVRDGTVPLVVSAGGSEDAAISTEFGESSPSGVRETITLPIAGDGTTRDQRYVLPRVAPGSDRARITARLAGTSPSDWLVVSAPRAPRLVPLEEVFPATAPALLDWPVAPLMPCQHIASLAGGSAEIPAFVLSGGRDQPEAMARSAGGPFAQVANVADVTPVPTYLEGAPTSWQPQVQRVELREGLSLPRVVVGARQVSAWTSGPALG
jgi:arabinosyltransferase C